MLKDRNSDQETETVEIDCQFEVYLKNRDDPILSIATFEIPREYFDKDQELEDFMMVAYNHIRGTIDVVGNHRFDLSDSKLNKFVFLTEEIQAISILAPSKETVLAALEK